MTEPVISSLKTQKIVQNGSWKEHSDIELATRTLVEWCNRSRHHGASEYLPPVEFEENHLKAPVSR